MTAVLAIDFVYKIVVLSDCRVSWIRGPEKRAEDNLIKIYPVDHVGVLAFSGDLDIAKAVFTRIRKEPQRGLGNSLALQYATIAKEEFSKLSVNAEDAKLQLLFAGLKNIESIRTGTNVSILPVGLFRFESPDFEVRQLKLAAGLGAADEIPLDVIKEIRDGLWNMGLDTKNKYAQVGIAIGALGSYMSHYGGEDVGKFILAGIYDLESFGWQQYGNADDVHLTVEGGRPVLHDPRRELKVKLKTIFEYSPAKDDPQELKIESPFR